MKKNQNLIKVVLGDWSDDGHGKTSTFIINSNRDTSNIEKAYKKGVAVLGFDFERKVAYTYEDSTIKIEYLKSLIQTGFEWEATVYNLKTQDYDDVVFSKQNDVSYETYEDSFCLDDESYLAMWFHVAKLGDPDLEYEIVKIQSLNIGGYGLFL